MKSKDLQELHDLWQKADKSIKHKAITKASVLFGGYGAALLMTCLLIF